MCPTGHQPRPLGRLPEWLELLPPPPLLPLRRSVVVLLLRLLLPLLLDPPLPLLRLLLDGDDEELVWRLVDDRWAGPRDVARPPELRGAPVRARC